MVSQAHFQTFLNICKDFSILNNIYAFINVVFAKFTGHFMEMSVNKR